MSKTSSEHVSAHKKLSSSLKERLKRCGRYHSSPISVPQKKRIYYPDGTLSQTPVKIEHAIKRDNCLDTQSTPTRCLDEEMGTDSSSTPLKSSDSAKLKIDSSIPAIRKNIGTFVSPSGFSDFVDDPTGNYRKLVSSNSLSAPKTPTTDSSLLQVTPKFKSNERPSTISVMSSPTVFDENSYSKEQSQKIRNYSKLSLTTNTKVPEMILENIDGNQISKQMSERTPIQSKNISLCCRPSRLQFSDMCDSSSTEDKLLAADEQKNESQITSMKESENGAKSISHEDTEMLQEKYEILKNTLKEKEEELRKLNMVKMYRNKNDLDSLRALITKWQKTSQKALVDLHEKLQDPKPSLTQLINHLQIEHSLVNFNAEEESFN
ncbi:swi5-dependent recombination DNA repair protein 1 homolog [Ylistrum balloti]|uniref:swi5-dependent recombination DNA repair protein 1 homolog n=1 Tax=Ylistrum balloti TaxID=509963 RepID=UPI002905A12E|nr:swi5-dependent recombination DNA repair protein 1 homolog [Ylistrum balloti]